MATLYQIEYYDGILMLFLPIVSQMYSDGGYCIWGYGMAQGDEQEMTLVITSW